MLHSHSIHKRTVVAHSITAIPCLPNRSVNAKTPALSITAIPCAKLFLGDLSFHCMDQEIVHEFAKKGFSCHVKIAFDMDGKPRGYGFAYFKTIELATLARNEFQGIKFHGRRMRIHYAGRYIEDQTPMNTLTSPINSVYVRFQTDLNVLFDEAYLESFFMSYGVINDVCIKDICKVLNTLFSLIVVCITFLYHPTNLHSRFFFFVDLRLQT